MAKISQTSDEHRIPASVFDQQQNEGSRYCLGCRHLVVPKTDAKLCEITCVSEEDYDAFCKWVQLIEPEKYTIYAVLFNTCFRRQQTVEYYDAGQNKLKKLSPITWVQSTGVIVNHDEEQFSMIDGCSFSHSGFIPTFFGTDILALKVSDGYETVCVAPCGCLCNIEDPSKPVTGGYLHQKGCPLQSISDYFDESLKSAF